MRKILPILIALSISTPAMAHGYYDTYRHEWHNDRSYEHEYRRNRDRSEGDIVLPLIGGVILGAILNGSQRRDNTYDRRRTDGDYVYRQPAPREYIYDPRCDCYR